MSTPNKLATGLGVACLAMAAATIDPAMAQTTVAPTSEPQAETTVIIRAERPTKRIVGYTSNKTAIEEYALSYHVDYSDLDLSTYAGATTLKKRVSFAADSVCKDLYKMYPRTGRDPGCKRKAEAGAKTQVDAAIEKAGMHQ